jgi:hypothetical protein
MADKKEVVETKETAVEKPKTAPTVVTPKQRSPLWYVLGTLVAVVFIILLAGAFRQAHDRQEAARTFDRSSSFGLDDRRMMRGGMMNDRDDISDTTHVSGVVTSIDGSIITVAGNGSSKKVTINDKTEYFGAAQPVKVNDSVQIKGTTSGETFTATRILTSRQ